MLKNVIIVNDFDYIQGGASKVAIQTANILKESNPKLNVYFFSGCHDESTILNKNVINICTNQGEALKDKNKLRGVFNGLYNIKVKNEFKNLLRTLNNKETIIHVHGWTKILSSSVFDIAFKMNFKVVLTMHDYFTACPNGGYFNYKKNEICYLKSMSWNCIKCNCDSRNYTFKLYRVLRQFIQNKIVKLPDKLEYAISISEFSEKILKKTLKSSTRIYRVYNPIDLDKNPEKVDYKKNKYFLYVGRVSKEKGVDIFCEAVSKAKVKGIVVGDGPELNHLKKEYPNIEFVGWKSSNEVKKYMRGAKALIFPSKWYEVAPLSPLEAMQYGVPVISSNCNAAKDYVNDDNKFENINDLKEKLKFNKFSANKIDLKKYSKEKYYESIFNLFNLILSYSEVSHGKIEKSKS